MAIITYSKGLKDQIIAHLGKIEEKARNYDESCRIRKVYNQVSPALHSGCKYVREDLKSGNMSDRSVIFLISTGMDEFADELWSIFPEHHCPI